jgi:hypothetical protein
MGVFGNLLGSGLGAAGGYLGGLLASEFGPVGTFVGANLGAQGGNYVGDKLKKVIPFQQGGMVRPMYSGALRNLGGGLRGLRSLDGPDEMYRMPQATIDAFRKANQFRKGGIVKKRKVHRKRKAGHKKR